MMYRFLLFVSINIIVSCTSIPEVDYRIEQVDILLGEERFEDAKEILHELLIEDPYDEEATKRLYVVSKTLFERNRPKLNFWDSPQIQIDTLYNDRFSTERILNVGPR